ncbi:hypothetical protein [Sphingomonas turrisvirgatae]|uniref:Uncharacterized protein n=1 Tax=Sphingomonas turrisvirgatae TaxID=1888892 RepID=A0A1E3LSQ7_9SPHN|nr:hypothetical protein [Sphingomonas turrisvirgatae]ODP36781.1 hypothetical protein BFL28_03460 [Sphingomonas turrisvirgatae]
MSDEVLLSEAKQRFLDAQQDVETLRQKIAVAQCPLQIGDTVMIVDGGKTYEGVVEHVGHAMSAAELLGPVVGAPTLWAASGHRVNKTTGQIGKWSFAIVSDSAEFLDGKWVIAERSIEAFLGLAPHNGR